MIPPGADLAMNQRKDLNRSRTPIRREQQVLTRRAAASDEDVAALRTEMLARLGTKANASTVGGLATSLQATKDDVEEIKEAIQLPED